MSEPILYEMHMHTTLCKHARGEPEDYAEVAEAKGLKGMVVTCHNPDNNGWSPGVRMAVEQYDEYIALVGRARDAMAGRVDVRLGLECDYIPGMEPWLTELIGKEPLNHVLCSIHPHIRDYRDLFWKDDIFDYQKTYFEHIAQGAESGLFDTISHPDLIKIIEPDEWDLDRISPKIDETLDRVAEAGTAMELNTSGLLKKFVEMNPGRYILEQMHKRNIPVVLGADAHDPHRVADHFIEAIDMLIDVGFENVSFFLDRQRQDIPIQVARASLK